MVRPALYQRSARRWLRAYSFANTCRSGSAGDLDTQRSRTARALQTERLDIEDLETQLLLHRGPDGQAPLAGHIEMGGDPTAVVDREHDLGNEQSGRRRRGPPDPSGPTVQTSEG